MTARYDTRGKDPKVQKGAKRAKKGQITLEKKGDT